MRLPSDVPHLPPPSSRRARGFVARCLVLLLAGLPARGSAAEPVRLLLSIGHNLGDPDEAPLRFADADARRVLSLFVEVGGVSSDRAFLSVNPSAAEVKERFAMLSGRVAELRASGQEATLLVYVSAHAKGGALHLGGSHLPLDELRRLAASTSARLRVLMVDACESGNLARRKGGFPGAGYAVTLERLPLAGEVLLSSSGPVEASQEWDSLGGSLFTHHWLTGLRGDADVDGDGRVSFSEAYVHAYRRTVVNAEAGSQHPAFDLDVSGSGDLILTEPSAARSALVFPAGLEGRYVVASQPRPDVVAEVEKRPGRALRLAVPPGRYLVRKRLGTRVGLLVLELPYGGEALVDEARLVRRDYREVALKGGVLELHPSAWMASVSTQTAPLAGTGAQWQGALGYRLAFEPAWLWAELGVGRRGYEASAVSTSEISLRLGLAGGWRAPLGPLTGYVGLGVAAIGLRQSYERAQEREIQQVLRQGALPERDTAGVSGGPMLALEAPVWGPLFAVARVDGLARYLPAERAASGSVGLSAQLGLGWRP